MFVASPLVVVYSKFYGAWVVHCENIILGLPQETEEGANALKERLIKTGERPRWQGEPWK